MGVLVLLFFVAVFYYRTLYSVLVYIRVVGEGQQEYFIFYLFSRTVNINAERN